jgi:hypothetical protein
MNAFQASREPRDSWTRTTLFAVLLVVLGQLLQADEAKFGTDEDSSSLSEQLVEDFLKREAEELSTEPRLSHLTRDPMVEIGAGVGRA